MVHKIDSKIVVFATIYKPHIGGLERYIEKFYKNLNERIVYILTFRLDASHRKVERDGNAIILRYGAIRFLKGKYYIPTLSSMFGLCAFVRRLNKPLIIHTHTRFYILNFLALVISKINRIKLVHFEHGATFVQDGSRLVKLIAWLYDQTISRIFLTGVDAVIPISDSTREFLLGKLSVSSGRVLPILPIGVDDNFKNGLRAPRSHLLKLLFVGRLIRAKGIFDLIDCCAELKKKGVDFEISIVGEGSDEGSLRDYISCFGLEQNVKVLGALQNEFVLQMYLDHDVFINPSYSEGGPTTVLEALAVNMPVISTKVGVTEQVLNSDRLILISELSGQKLADAVVDYIENWDSVVAEHEEYGANVRQSFSWRMISGKYNEIEEVICQSGS